MIVDGGVFPHHACYSLFSSGSSSQHQQQLPVIHSVRREFNPYSDNGGAILGIAGKDYLVIAADTRLSENYFVPSRNVTRIFQVWSLSSGIFLS